MRCPRDPQPNIFHIMPKNKVGQELTALANVLDVNRQILDLVFQNLFGLRQADTAAMD